MSELSSVVCRVRKGALLRAVRIAHRERVGAHGAPRSVIAIGTVTACAPLRTLRSEGEVIETPRVHRAARRLHPGRVREAALAPDQSGSQVELHALVAGSKAQRFVKSPRVEPRLVAGELHQSATSAPAFADSPFEQPAPDPFAPDTRCDPDALDLTAPHAQARQTRNEGDLNAPDDGAAADRDRHQLIGIALQCVEGIDILAIDRSGGVFPGASQLIVGQQCDNARQVRALRRSKDDLGHARNLTRRHALVATPFMLEHSRAKYLAATRGPETMFTLAELESVMPVVRASVPPTLAIDETACAMRRQLRSASTKDYIASLAHGATGPGSCMLRSTKRSSDDTAKLIMHRLIARSLAQPIRRWSIGREPSLAEVSVHFPDRVFVRATGSSCFGFRHETSCARWISRDQGMRRLRLSSPVRDWLKCVDFGEFDLCRAVGSGGREKLRRARRAADTAPPRLHAEFASAV